MRTPLAFLLLATSASLGAQEILGRRDRVFTLTERLTSGAEVRIFNHMGSITVSEGSGDALEYRAEKERGDADDVGFIVRREAGG